MKKALNVSTTLIITYAIALICLFGNYCNKINSYPLYIIIVYVLPIILTLLFAFVRYRKNLSIKNIKKNLSVKNIILCLICLLFTSYTGEGILLRFISIFYKDYIYIDDPSVYPLGIFYGISTVWITVRSLAFYCIVKMFFYKKSEINDNISASEKTTVSTNDCKIKV